MREARSDGVGRDDKRLTFLRWQLDALRKPGAFRVPFAAASLAAPLDLSWMGCHHPGIFVGSPVCFPGSSWGPCRNNTCATLRTAHAGGSTGPVTGLALHALEVIRHVFLFKAPPRI